MKILAFTDLHAKTGILKALEEPLKNADLILLAGDITHFGREKEISGIIQQIAVYNSNIYGVTGNCDHAEAEHFLSAKGYNLNAQIIKFSEYYLFGIGGSLPCPGKTPNEYSEQEYDAILSEVDFPENKPLIVVSHQPPWHTKNDEVSPGYHVGSTSIRRFIEKHQPVACFTGHIHEGIAVDYVGKTAIINPGPAGHGKYALVDISGFSVISVELKNYFA